MEEKTRRKLKISIIILAILLAIGLLLLFLIHNCDRFPALHFLAIIKDNIIKPAGSGTESQTTETQTETQTQTQTETQTQTQTQTETTTTTATATTPGTIPGGPDTGATTLSLYNRNADDNIPFKVVNMFPGDRETHNYCIRVFHNGTVILRFHADIRAGYEKLAEVLCCRVVLSDSGEVLYDGLMRDMPDPLNHPLYANAKTTSYVGYEITVYLKTSVGNEYMNQRLVADFRWWVEEKGNLDRKSR